MCMQIYNVAVPGRKYYSIMQINCVNHVQSTVAQTYVKARAHTHSEYIHKYLISLCSTYEPHSKWKCYSALNTVTQSKYGTE